MAGDANASGMGIGTRQTLAWEPDKRGFAVSPGPYAAPADFTTANMTTGHSIDHNMTSNASLEQTVNVYSMRFGPYTALSGCCFLFNVLSIGAMWKIRGRRKVHHVLLLNLAVCDLCGTVLLWMYYNSPHIFPHFKIKTLEHCLFIAMVLVGPFLLSLCMSGLSLLMLALNQYIAIIYPIFSTTSVSKGRACIFVIIAWIVGGIVAMIPAFLMLLLTQFDHCNKFAVSMGVKSMEICAYALAALILIIVGLYARIYYEVLEYRHRTPQLARRSRSMSTDPRANNGETEHNYKAFITTLLLSGTLCIFWLPYMVFNFISTHMDLSETPDIVIYVKFYIIDFLPMLTFLTDPIIYGIRMREIREGYRRLFADCFPCCIAAPHAINRASVRFTSLETTTI